MQSMTEKPIGSFSSSPGRPPRCFGMCLSGAPVFGRRSKSPFYTALFGVIVLFLVSAGAEAHMDLAYPDGPMTVNAHQLLLIRWHVYISHGPGTIRIEYSINGGSTYTQIVDGIPYNDTGDDFGGYVWVVPEVESTDCKIQVIYESPDGDYHNGMFPGENNPTFTITNEPTFEVVLEEGVSGYLGTRDNTIYEENTNTNGGGDFIFSGNTNTPNARRALIAFDLGGVPAEATVLSASLRLTVSKTISATSVQTLHRLGADWGEGTQNALGEEGQGTAPATDDATWLSNFHGTSSWTSAGGDFAAIPSATAEVVGIGHQPVWIHPQMVADVQSWVSGSAGNYGWILIGEEGASATAKRYHSADSSTAAAGQRPRLVVRYVLSSSVSGWEHY